MAGWAVAEKKLLQQKQIEFMILLNAVRSVKGGI